MVRSYGSSFNFSFPRGSFSDDSLKNSRIRADERPAGYRRKASVRFRKNNAAAVQELPVNTDSRPLLPKRFCTVFRVAENRMPDAGKMRPQLMRFTGNQLCLHKR